MTEHWNWVRGHSCLLAILLTLTFHAQLTLAGLDRVCSPGMGPVRGGVCGSRLPMVLGNLCSMFHSGGPSVTKFLMKRSAERDPNEIDENLRSIMLNKRDAFSFLPSKRQGIGRRSIVCECCYHRCTMLELIQYCEFNDQYVSRRQGRSVKAAVSRDRMLTMDDSYS